ncbi:hypothetical protein ACL02S_23815 [Nocardia sp. 004]|uniref:hypothetical protein n=1 Tax=Nocardia sp. 004 TaxID=3385978 RepID=UPI0039A07FAA
MNPPTLTADSFADRDPADLLPILGNMHGYLVRYLVHVDSSHPRQSRFQVEVFSPATMRWNELWALDPHEFYVSGGPPEAMELDPTSFFGAVEVDIDAELAALGPAGYRPLRVRDTLF